MEPTKRQDRAWRLTLIRLLLAVLGLVAVFVGLRNAWTSHSTAAPLIVGGVFLAAALIIDPTLNEISARYRDAELRVVRGRVLNAAGVIRSIAATGDIDADTRVQLEQVAVEVERESQVVSDGSRPGSGLTRHLRRLIWDENAALVEQPLAYDDVDDEEARAAYFAEARSGYEFNRGVVDWGVPVPSYSLQAFGEGEGRSLQIYVWLRWWGDWRIECHVRAPSGHTSARVFHGSVHMQGNNFNLTYPREFPDTPPIETAGDYVFTWRRVAREERTVLAQDTITIEPNMLDKFRTGVSTSWRGTPVTEEQLAHLAEQERHELVIHRTVFALREFS